MKNIFLNCVIFLVATQASAQITDGLHVPDVWEKDFTIKLTFTGSMDGSSTYLTFTHDSITYIHNSRMNPTKRSVHLMTPSDRIVILKKLKELKIDRVRSENSFAPVRDGWSQSICFKYNCVEAGTSAKMTDKDKAVFSDAYGFLEEFAGDKK